MSARNTQTLTERLARRRIDLFHRRLNPALSQAIRKQKEAHDDLICAIARGTALDIQAAQLRLGQAAATVLRHQEADAERDVGVASLTPTFLNHLTSIDTGDDDIVTHPYDAHGQLVHNRAGERQPVSLGTHMVVFVLLLALDPYIINVFAAAVWDATARVHGYSHVVLAGRHGPHNFAQLCIIKAIVSYILARFMLFLSGGLF